MGRNVAKKMEGPANHEETGEFEDALDAEMAEKILRDIEEGHEKLVSGQKLTETLDRITR
ncbi:MAG: hypothetical protein OXL41_08260 [Nitrospinae bacterium]|nr:hypothetical protein [Nitrospinota bacterium]